MTTIKPPTAPPDLGREGKRLWRDVLGEYDMTDAELRVLEQACQAADRVAMARAAIDAQGVTVDGRYGPRLNPAISVERDQRAQMLRALKDLGVVDRRERAGRDLHTPGPKPGVRR